MRPAVEELEGRLTPTNITLTLSPTPLPLGQTSGVTTTATVTDSNGFPVAVGQVTFSTDLGDSVTDTMFGAFQGTVSASLRNWTAGWHTLTAAYSGGGPALPDVSTSQLLDVLVPTTASAAPLTSPLPPGQTTTLSGHVTPLSGEPTPAGGFLEFFVDGQSEGQAPVDTSGNAALNVSSLMPGNHQLTVQYLGLLDSYPHIGYASSAVSDPVAFTVNKFTPTTTLAGSANPAAYDQPVTLNELVLGPTGMPVPTGTVTFTDENTGLSLGTVTVQAPYPGFEGVANLSLGSLAAGTHPILAAYSGDANYAASTITLNEVINPVATTTTLTSSAGTSSRGQAFTFTATVGNADPFFQSTLFGTLTVVDQTTGTALASANVGSTGQPFQFSFTTSSLPAGNDTIVASYSPPNSNFAASSASLTEVVKGLTSTTTLTSSANPAAFGQPVTLTAAVTGPTGGPRPTGSVTFTYTTVGLSLGTVMLDANGDASLPLGSFPVGTYPVLASYSGDANYAASTITLNEVVNPVATTTTLTSSAGTSQLGQSVTFTATVAPSDPAGGTVTFTDQTTGTPLGTVNLDGHGHASFTTNSLSAGSHSIVASYIPPNHSNFTTSSVSLVEVVNSPPRPTPPPPAPAAPPVPVTVILVPHRFGKHTELVAEVLFSDGSVSEIAVPFRQPKFKDLRASLADVNPADGRFELLFTALKGKKTVISRLPL
jgi:hypothetical protein